jgi:hypothetical protein
MASRHRARYRDGGRYRAHGITEADYDQMLEAQGGVCAVCEARPPAHIDHDHDTGAVRGLLCHSCNTAIGALGDNLAGLQRAVDYLTLERDSLVAM